jgi:hypothetical protein
MSSALEEEHARLMLSRELDQEFDLYDDGSIASMPDLVSLDRRHAAEVVTTAPFALRKAEQHLAALAEPRLPHCVLATVPYSRLGGVTRAVRRSIETDVFRWTTESRCVDHWAPHGGLQLALGRSPDPILGLRGYDDGIRVYCVQTCQHPADASHQINWSVVHEPSSEDPWMLLRRSLQIIDEQHRGGVSALANKLSGFPNKHLVMYPFGPPGNLTAFLGGYVAPIDLADLLPPVLNAPLTDIHLWIVVQYGGSSSEGLHVCNGRWSRLGAEYSKLAVPSANFPSHYREL